jgi:hypothetical protein
MRSAGNFSPEWGYLAPVPSFARTARVVLVATAIGATAGAGVVLSLIDHPSEPEKTAIAARAIVTSVRAEAMPSVAPTPASTAPTTSAAPAKPALPSRASLAAAPPSAKPAAMNAAAPTPAASTATVSPNSAAPAAAQPISALPAAAANAGAAVPASVPASASASAGEEPSTVVDAPPAGEQESTTIAAPEQAPPAKKAKHHASSNKNQFPGIGAFFRRAFASHGSRSYYPNSQ